MVVNTRMSELSSLDVWESKGSNRLDQALGACHVHSIQLDVLDFSLNGRVDTSVMSIAAWMVISIRLAENTAWRVHAQSFLTISMWQAAAVPGLP